MAKHCIETESRKANVDFHSALADSYVEQPFFREENQQRVRAILSRLSVETGSRRLLDVGCGTGFILDLAYDLFEEIDGIDITPDMLKQVKPRSNVRVQLVAAEEMPFGNDQFDVVTLYSVLHHLPDLSSVFKQVRRVLRPGGVLFADESPSEHFRAALTDIANQQKLGGSLKKELEKFTEDADRFCTRYGIDSEITRKAMIQNYDVKGLTEENLRSVLADAGFRDVEISFRQCCGYEDLQSAGGACAIEQVQQYLQDMLPLTRHLFKYFVLIAK